MVDRTPDEALQAVTDADVGVDSLIAYNTVLKQRVADALSGATLPPAVQDKLNKVFDLSTADLVKTNAALNA